MEAVYLQSSADFRNPRKVNRQISLPAPSNFHGGNGILYTPPLSLSYSSSFSPNPRQHHQNHPPLLPLPIPKPCQNNTRRINNRTNHQSLSVRKSNASNANPRREKSKQVPSDSVIVATINRLGPDPKELPKDVSRVLFLGNSKGANNDQVVKFSGTVVASVLSPPPSSLPLPTFSLRPKLSCQAEAAAGVDAGATDNLRRILRLR